MADLFARRPWLATVLVAGLGGGLLALAHSRLAVWPAAWLAPATLVPLALGAGRGPRLLAALLLGAIGSLGLIGLAWVPQLAVALVLVASLEALAVLWLLAALHRRLPVAVLALVPPSVLTTAEFLLAASPLGTATSDAYAMHAALPLLQLTAVTGPHGLTFLAAWAGTALGLALWRPDRPAWRRPLRPVAVAVLLVAGSGWLVLRADHDGASLTVAAVHAPTAPGKAADLAQTRDRIAAHAPLVLEAAEAGAAVVIWPEMILSLEPAWEPAVMDDLAALARASGAWQVVGIAHREPARNTARVLDPRGRLRAEYQKTHLVAAMERSAPGTAPAPVISTGQGRLGVLICNDDVFTGVARQLARDGAQLVADPTWDWAAVAWRHAQITRVRAVETGCAYVRATQGGISQLIDPRGRVLAEHSTLAEPRQVLVGAVPLGGGGTVFSRSGDLFAWTVVGLLAGLVMGTVRPVRRPLNPSTTTVPPPPGGDAP